MTHDFNWDQHARINPSSAMAAGTPASSSISDEQLNRELTQLLDSPIVVIAGGDRRVEAHVEQLAESQDPPLRFVVDMVRTPTPPVELLEIAKGFAKHNYRHGTDRPRPVSLVVYYMTIVVALLRCDRRITSLKHHVLRRGVAFCASEPWLDPETGIVLQEGLDLLDNRVEPVASEEASSEAPPPLM